MNGEPPRAPKKEPWFLAAGVHHFWQLIRARLLWPLQQLDALTCTEPMLNLLAWERDIRRFRGEPLELYRKRVKYAFANARDAGETAGFKRIFERLGIGWVEIAERMPGVDWDVINIRVTDSAIARKQDLMQVLIEHYGRTCRRYRFEVIYQETTHVLCGHFGGSYQLFCASRRLSVTQPVRRRSVSGSSQVFVASLRKP
ncbi:phage tail protein [Zobellella denitrificans]|nr:phage tail protein [Zobellella denitrificans]